jgi:glucose/arabinose dehydrogenase
MRSAHLAAALVAIALTCGCSGGQGEQAGGKPSGKAQAQSTAQPPPGPRYDFPRARRILVPRGFRAEVYASGLERPTAMAYGPDARLYVTEETGRVVVARPLSSRPRPVASGFDTPLGLAWKQTTLFVSSQGRMDALRFRHGRVVGRRTVVSRLPYGRHQQDNVVVGRDGRLYFGSGSTCDACREHDRRSATILSVLPSGRELQIVASGLRNPFGLVVQPETGELYASVNSRDDLPDPSSPEPAEMLVRVESGANYGWPPCWPSARLERMRGSCVGVERPVAYLEAHSAAAGLAFNTGESFPTRYREGVFVALWGQYDSREHGRRVDFVRLRPDGTSPRDGVSAFADGFEHPLALAVDPHGALLVADWGRGVIYRIQARGRP